MEKTDKKNQYIEYMTLAALPETIIKQYKPGSTDKSENTGRELLEKGHRCFQEAVNEQDYKKAVEYYQKAAKLGEADACFALSICYQYGKGVAADPEQDKKMYDMAAKLKRQSVSRSMGMVEKKNLLSPDFQKILFQYPRSISKMKQIVFSGKIHENAFVNYHKDISADGDGSVIGWVEDTTLHIEGNGGITAPVNCSGLFESLRNIESIQFNHVFDTGQTENMSFMFSGCLSLKELDVSGFDTRRIKEMYAMFKNCSGLKKLNISGWNTSRVENMSSLFMGCDSLIDLDVSSFDTGKVRKMSFMFSGCSSLEKLDVSSFDTVQAEDLSYMFFGCSNLEEISGLEQFDISRVKDMKYMFALCGKLKNADFSRLDVEDAVRTDMFSGCNALSRD